MVKERDEFSDPAFIAAIKRGGQGQGSSNSSPNRRFVPTVPVVNQAVLTNGSKQSLQEPEKQYFDDIEIPPLTEARRLLTAPWWAWLIVLIGWVIGGVRSVTYFNYSWIVFISYLILFVAWLKFCYDEVSESERVKPVFLSIVGKLVGSGPVFVLRPLEKLIRYTTNVMQLEFLEGAGIKTLATKDHPSYFLPVIPVMNFMYAWRDDDLTASVKNAPPPTEEGRKELKNLIREPFLDVVREVGGRHDDDWIARNRVTFAEEVTDELKKKRDLIGMIKLLKLYNITVAMQSLDVPKKMKDALEEEAAALPSGRAAGIKERETRFGIAAGDAEIRRAIMTIATDPKFEKIALEYEGNITMRQLGTGGKATFLAIPPEMYGALGSMFGGRSPEKALGISKEQLEPVLISAMQKVLAQQLKRGGNKR